MSLIRLVIIAFPVGADFSRIVAVDPDQVASHPVDALILRAVLCSEFIRVTGLRVRAVLGGNLEADLVTLLYTECFRAACQHRHQADKHNSNGNSLSHTHHCQS